MFTRQGLLLTWKESRRYFVFACLLFFASAFVGGATDTQVDWMNGQLEQFDEIRQEIEGSDTPERTMFFILIGKNLLACVMAMGFGIMGAIMPIVVLVTNGLLLGYVLKLSSWNDQNVWLAVVKGILPHGVFELSAVFLACAFGIRFGLTFLRGVSRSLTGKDEPWRPFARTAIGAIPGLIAIVVLLLIAALVESTVTYWLAT
ncbi:stage II sporulation protein M [Cohnella panacarvi]|uniref:stage II sporulation protein M n=1 Tax=Cohnella panacarvi TaxID=400776 RepID=UPI00047E06F4|nr:stage II sporulation protein M [Cohnella panacarvi]